jgi:hypothetical protein
VAKCNIIVTNAGLPRLHRAGPSTSLDKSKLLDYWTMIVQLCPNVNQNHQDNAGAIRWELGQLDLLSKLQDAGFTQTIERKQFLPIHLVF